MRPQRGSRDTSIIGAKVQLMPLLAASSAAIRAPSRAMSGLKLAACPSGNGMTVAKPWMTSRPTSNGMPSRLCSTAMRCSSLATPASATFSIDPRRPARSRSPRYAAGFGSLALSCVICPTFSATVISASSAATRRSRSSGGRSACTVGTLIVMIHDRPQIAAIFVGLRKRVIVRCFRLVSGAAYPAGAAAGCSND